MQYSLTNVNAFFVVLAIGYLIHSSALPNGRGASNAHKQNTDITFISQLKGQFYANPILGLSLALCLFSMAGIPPLVGFFAKYMVLYSAIENGYSFLALVGILASVISAAYYLRIIRVIHFDANAVSDLRSERAQPSNAGSTFGTTLTSSTMSKAHRTADESSTTYVLSSTHSYVIAVLTLFITLFILSPSLFLNSSNLLALSLFTA